VPGRHYLSPRASKPFISFNCGAIPTELMENELFGHVQGAFTGASASQPGLIRQAQPHIEEGRAEDLWSHFKSEYVATGQFE
jgi:sigma54-dependent transcription regulator